MLYTQIWKYVSSFSHMATSHELSHLKLYGTMIPNENPKAVGRDLECFRKSPITLNMFCGKLLNMTEQQVFELGPPSYGLRALRTVSPMAVRHFSNRYKSVGCL